MGVVTSIDYDYSKPDCIIAAVDLDPKLQIHEGSHAEVVSDFIFTYIGQCFGFVGCVAVIVIFMVLTIKILLDSFRTRDLLGKYICIGVYAMFSIFEDGDHGLAIGLMPVIGVPLPFLSQGGTSALATYIGIGLVLSTNIHREKKDHMVLYNDNQ